MISLQKVEYSMSAESKNFQLSLVNSFTTYTGSSSVSRNQIFVSLSHSNADLAGFLRVLINKTHFSPPTRSNHFCISVL